MATVVDLLRKLGKRASSEPNALAGPIVLAGAPPGAAAADAAGVAQAGARGSIALLGHGAPVQSFLVATVMSRLRAQPNATGLWIVPPGSGNTAAIKSAAREAGIEVLEAAGALRIGPAQIVLATPLQLHRHLLLTHDRAWSWLWPRLEHLVLPELHSYAGAPAAQLRWLLRRVARLRERAGAVDAPVLAASMAPVANADAALAMFTDHGKLVQGRVRLIRLDDRPQHATLVALWRCGPDRAAELNRLVAELAAHKLQTDILDGVATPGARVNGTPTAHVAVAPRIPYSAAERNTLLRCGYRLLIMLAGDEPHELLIADHPDRLGGEEPVFPDGSENPYIAAPQLCCAAAELPLVDAELDRWGAVELRDRLEKRGALVSLPGEHAWFAQPEPPDPYHELDPRAIGGEPYHLLAPDGSVFSMVPPYRVERSARAGAVVAPGMRVTAVDHEQRTITTAPDPTAIATLLAAGAEVAVRDELAARQVRQLGIEITRGRVTITQRMLGLRDLQADGTQRRVSIQPPHETQWSAAACWLKLPLPEGARLPDPATAGWSLVFAAPLLMLATPDALTAAYDEERRILYLVETEPGGTGVAAALYEQFEQALEDARSLLAACSRRPAWERSAASEAQLLAALAGGRAARAAARVYTAQSPAAPGASPSLPDLPEVPTATPGPPAGSARIYAAEPTGAGTAHDQAQRGAAARARHPEPAGRPGSAETPDPLPDRPDIAAQRPDQPETQPRILRFPTRPRSDQQGGRRAASIQRQDGDPGNTTGATYTPGSAAARGRRSAIYETRSAPYSASAPRSGAPDEPKASGTATQGRFEIEADQPPAAPAAQAADTNALADSSPPATSEQPPLQNNAPMRRRDRVAGDPAAPPPPDEPRKPDVQALIERMRRLREEREAQQRDAQEVQAELAARLLPPIEPDDGEPRFHIGQRVQCLPYGTGIVRSSRRSDERELVLIEFPDYGEIEVDSAVSLLRPIEDQPPEVD